MKIIEPSAKCVDFPTHGERIIYMAARRCYSAGNYMDLIDDANGASTEAMRKLIQACIKSGHHSVLEHSSFSFHVTCSRACSHQLVRHRVASYSQQSQRYCKFDDIEIIRPAMQYESGAEKVWEDHLLMVEPVYKALLNGGLDAEDARSVLPNCTATHLIVTMNCRELLHFFEERTCNKAQLEIRTIANKMLDFCKLAMPTVFENAGPKCLRLDKCPESKPCGKNPWWRNHA